MLPPGRASDATIPDATGILLPMRKRLECLAAACLAANNRASHRNYEIHFELKKLSGYFRVALASSLSPTILDFDRAAIDPPTLT